MSNIKEVNGRLTNQPYVSGFVPSKDDATLFTDIFGANNAVVQWAAQMAAYYATERADILKGTPKGAAAAAAPAPKAAAKPAAKAAAAPAAAADDDIDLFGEETEEEAEARLAKKVADAKAKSGKKDKPAVIAKSSILMDIKPFDDETDLEELAKKLKSIEKDGLLWGAHKLVPVAYGVKKLQILMVIEDDKVASDDIEDMVMAFEDDVQSMDVVAWNKV